MRRFFIGICCAVMLISSMTMLYRMLKIEENNSQHPIYKGTYHPALIQRQASPFLSDIPQPQIKLVNVSVKQYHVKANQFRYQLDIHQNTNSNSNGALTLSSSQTMHSYGGRVHNNDYRTSQSQSHRNITSSHPATFSLASPQRATLASSDRYKMQNRWTNAYSAVYRGSVGDSPEEWLGDYLATSAGGSGIESNGSGGWLVTQDWLDNLYSYLAGIGIAGADPRLLDFTTWFNAQPYSLKGSGTTPPPGPPVDPEQMPIGNGILCLIFMSLVYMIFYRYQRVSNI